MKVLDLRRVAPGPQVREQVLQLVHGVHCAGTEIKRAYNITLQSGPKSLPITAAVMMMNILLYLLF